MHGSGPVSFLKNVSSRAVLSGPVMFAFRICASSLNKGRAVRCLNVLVRTVLAGPALFAVE